MALFGETVPREMYDDMKRARDIWQQECSALRVEMSALMHDVIAVKRHELGIPPAGTMPVDPLAVLGPKTKAAIDKVSEGYADLRAQQTNHAVAEMNVGLAHRRDPDELDAELAASILEGDEG